MKPMDKMRIALKSGDLAKVKEIQKSSDFQVYAGEFATLSIYYKNPKLLEYFFK